MGFHNINVVVLIRANLLTQANNWLAKQGMGDGVFKRELILIADPDDQPARGYAGILTTDISGWEMLRKVIEGQANCYIFADQRKKEAAQQALDFIASKGFRLKPQG